MADRVHVGDTGTVITKTIKKGSTAVDVSDITTITLINQHPDGTETTLTGSFTTDGEDGKVKFTTVVGTWTKPGLWTEQIRLQKSGGDWRCVAEHRDVMPAI